MRKDQKRPKVGFKERLSYEFDNIMAKGPIALVGLLFAITLLVIVIVGLAVVFVDKQYNSIAEAIWISFMHTLDAGNLAGDEGDVFFILVMTLATICGLFVTSILIGIISNGIENKMEALRKGRSHILDKDHTVILGFNNNIYVMIYELIEANLNANNGVIVIMDDVLEKEEMEELIRSRISDFKNTKIICRKGTISDITDLKICSLENAKSVIINSEDDFVTIKSILAVTSILKKANNKETYITAVIKYLSNYTAAKIAGEGRVEILFFDDTIARIIVHTCRMPGYSRIYTELLKYEGDEIYVESIPEAEGLLMKDVNLYFRKSTILGIKRNDEILLNPEAGLAIKKNDKLILIAEDDGVSNVLNGMGPYDKSLFSHNIKPKCDDVSKILILRYGPRLGYLLDEFDKYLAKGSEILIAAKHEYNDDFSKLINEYKNIKVTTVLEDIYLKDNLNKVLAWNPDSVLVLSGYHDDSERDDSKSLLVLLQLRALIDEFGYKFNITSEIRESKNKELSEITNVRNFVISSDIISLMVTKISQTRELNAIYDEILSIEGSEIYMYPAEQYVELAKPMNIYTAVMAVSNKHQVFMGYRRINQATGEYMVFNNPEKNAIVTFNKDDRFIVLSEN